MILTLYQTDSGNRSASSPKGLPRDARRANKLASMAKPGSP